MNAELCARYLEATGMPAGAAREHCADPVTRRCVAFTSGEDPTLNAFVCCYGPGRYCDTEEAEHV